MNGSTFMFYAFLQAEIMPTKMGNFPKSLFPHTLHLAQVSYSICIGASLQLTYVLIGLPIGFLHCDEILWKPALCEFMEMFFALLALCDGNSTGHPLHIRFMLYRWFHNLSLSNDLTNEALATLTNTLYVLSGLRHYNDVIMDAMASQITSLTNVYSTVYPGADQRKHQSSASLAFVRGIHRWPVNS